MIARLLRQGLSLIVVMTVVTGIAYPVFVAGIALGIFPEQARGSLIEKDGKAIGSAIIGQDFTSARYFWARPSATSPQPYNGIASGGSNQGPLNPALIDKVKAAAQALRTADPQNTAPIPVDLVTASASGLDPDITPAGAYYQAGRVARARGLDIKRVNALIAATIQPPTLIFAGEPRVNVLQLNLALDLERHGGS